MRSKKRSWSSSPTMNESSAVSVRARSSQPPTWPLGRGVIRSDPIRSHPILRSRTSRVHAVRGRPLSRAIPGRDVRPVHAPASASRRVLPAPSRRPPWACPPRPRSRRSNPILPNKLVSPPVACGSPRSDHRKPAIPEVLSDREPQLGGDASILGACPLDEPLVVVRVDEGGDRNSLDGAHDLEHSNRSANTRSQCIFAK